MNCQAISLIPDAPPGFTFCSPTKRDLLRGQLSLFAPSLESCASLLDGFFDRVEGLIITREDGFGFKKVGPCLWHLAITADSTYDLKELASFCLTQIETQSSLSEQATHLSTLLDRSRREHEQTRTNFYSYENHLAAKVEHLRQEIKQRKQVEEQLRLFKMFAENSQQGVGWVDVDGRIAYLNPSMATLHGRSDPSSFIGRNMLEFYSPADQKQLTEIIIPETLQTGSWEGELTLVQPGTGERIPAYHRARLIRDPETNQSFLAAIITDLREQKKNEQELLKIKKLEAVGFLAGGIAHDFNNLLAAILGNIELAEINTPAGSEATYYLERAKHASMRAKSLTKQLLTFAKGGQPVLQQESISAILMDSADFILHGSAVACHYKIPDNLLDIQADSGQISQVIQNLIINACHAMPDGGDIHFSCQNLPAVPAPDTAEKPMVRIVISDTGCGISPEHIDNIFDPYYSTKPTGSGLGLAICHSVITKHGGRISVQSKPGAGTTFSIELPAVADSRTGQQHTAQTNDSVSKSEPFRILIMDDEPTIRRFTSDVLEAFGHEAITAKDGNEAVAIYRQQMQSGSPIHLTFLDLTVPGGMGGKETIGELKKIDPNSKVIVFSGYSDDPVMANYEEYGFSAAIAKPFSIAELRSLIETTELEPSSGHGARHHPAT